MSPTRRFLVALLIGGPEQHQPPACFYFAALRALRDGLDEPVVLLNAGKSSSSQLALRLLQERDVYTSNAISGWPVFEKVAGAATAVKRLGLNRTKPWDDVWRWCNPAFESCELLEAVHTGHEVQMRPQPSTSAGMDNHSQASACSGQEVRSTLAREWVAYPLTIGTMDAGLSRGEWIREDACLISGSHLATGRGTNKEPAVLGQGHAGTRQLLWPLPWPDAFTEYKSAGAHGWVRQGGRLDAKNGAPNCTWEHNRDAFVAQSTMDNMYHMLMHAVPTLQLYLRARFRHQPDLVPRFLFYEPTSFTRSRGWQMFGMALGIHLDQWPHMAARSHALIHPAGVCRCYRRVVGGHAYFLPDENGISDGKKAHRQVAALQRAVAASMGGLPVVQMKRVIFLERLGTTRQIVNLQSLRQAVQKDRILKEQIHFACFENLPLAEQFRIVSTSRGIAGVHGQGLAWSLMLPSGGPRGTLEIIGQWRTFHRLDYWRTSGANGVRYMKLKQANAPECVACVGCNFRTCGNITANITQVVQALHGMVSYIRGV